MCIVDEKIGNQKFNWIYELWIGGVLHVQTSLGDKIIISFEKGLNFRNRQLEIDIKKSRSKILRVCIEFENNDWIKWSLRIA